MHVSSWTSFGRNDVTVGGLVGYELQFNLVVVLLRSDWTTVPAQETGYRECSFWILDNFISVIIGPSLLSHLLVCRHFYSSELAQQNPKVGYALVALPCFSPFGCTQRLKRVPTPPVPQL